MADSPDIEFDYGDTDTYDNEIAELYSYTEGPEFQLNLKAFEEICGELKVVPLWQSLTSEGRTSLVIRLSDYLELCDRKNRMKAARAFLYIVQGCWGEVLSDKEQNTWVRDNVFLLLRCGIWSHFIELLHIEMNSDHASTAHKMTGSISLESVADMRIILSIVYTIVETVRVPHDDDSDEFKSLREDFQEDLGQPQGDREELLVMTLMSMVTKFCNSTAPYVPIRKVLLLLWKVILVSLGDTTVLKNKKNESRKALNLETNWEDTLEVARTMRPSSPPITQADYYEQQNNLRKRPFKRQQVLTKQSSLDDSVAEMDLSSDDEVQPADVDAVTEPVENVTDVDDPPELPQPSSPRPATPAVEIPQKMNKGLPWTPKVREKDIDSFLDLTRLKFVGYPLQGDRTSLFGLPQPIHEGVGVLFKHIYISSAEVQIKREDEITQNPLSKPEGEVEQTPTEILYQALLPTLPQCMIALLKILLAAAPTSKSKTDSINIMADVVPEEIPVAVIPSLTLGFDVNRHKEVLVKSVSAILLLLLKHFKINHTYQFEFMSQHLVFANCIPLILKFFNQNIVAYVQAKNTISLLDFPACVIGDPPEMTAQALQACVGTSAVGSSPTVGNGDSSPTNSVEATTSFCCWRNAFSCVNLLRILNKLCKWKHSRIMMLVVFKSAPILKRALKVRHAILQLYVLKLLKMQTKYLGRQWRKTNMKTLSAIYQKVRHRLNDDWAYGNDPEARPWDFQAEECALRACVDRFNSRRYNSSAIQDPDFEPVDNCVNSILGYPVELTEEFKRHYEIWLQQEVLSTTIDWDQLVTQSA